MESTVDEKDESEQKETTILERTKKENKRFEDETNETLEKAMTFLSNTDGPHFIYARQYFGKEGNHSRWEKIIKSMAPPLLSLRDLDITNPNLVVEKLKEFFIISSGANLSPDVKNKILPLIARNLNPNNFANPDKFKEFLSGKGLANKYTKHIRATNPSIQWPTDMSISSTGAIPPISPADRKLMFSDNMGDDFTLPYPFKRIAPNLFRQIEINHWQRIDWDTGDNEDIQIDEILPLSIRKSNLWIWLQKNCVSGVGLHTKFSIYFLICVDPLLTDQHQVQGYIGVADGGIYNRWMNGSTSHVYKAAYFIRDGGQNFQLVDMALGYFYFYRFVKKLECGNSFLFAVNSHETAKAMNTFETATISIKDLGLTYESGGGGYNIKTS